MAWLKKKILKIAWAREIAHQVKSTVLAEYWGSIPTTYKVAHSHSNSITKGSGTFSALYKHQAQVVHRIYADKTPIHMK